MSERILSPASYAVILVLLLLLTILTVGVSFAPLSGAGHIVVGLLIAATKASLVVLFFMHALYSPRLTWSVVAVAIAFAVILFGLTFSDYLTREMIPFLPGH